MTWLQKDLMAPNYYLKLSSFCDIGGLCSLVVERKMSRLAVDQVLFVQNVVLFLSTCRQFANKASFLSSKSFNFNNMKQTGSLPLYLAFKHCIIKESSRLLE